MEKLRAAKKVAPDGGWGWVATFGVSLVNVSSRFYEIANSDACFDLSTRLHASGFLFGLLCLVFIFPLFSFFFFLNLIYLAINTLDRAFVWVAVWRFAK